MRYLALTAALLLAACGSKSEKEIASGTVTDPDTGETADYRVTTRGDGDAANVSIKTDDGEMSFGGGAANAKLPDGFVPFPGSKMTGGFTAKGENSTAGMASFEAPGKAEDVIAHFRRQAEAAGMTVKSEVKTGATLMIGAEKADNDKSGVQITATQEGAMVRGSITYGVGS